MILQRNSVGMPRNHIYSLRNIHAKLRENRRRADRGALLDAQSAAQRQPGHSHGDPASRLAERPPTPTAGCLESRCLLEMQTARSPKAVYTLWREARYCG
eukprot:scaffold102121_cov33-Phaeocystis_antarctica.AAC.2